MMKLTKLQVQHFADSFKKTKLIDNTIFFGSFRLKANKIIKGELVNFSNEDLLDFKQQYKVLINKQTVRFYIQLYENITSANNKQFRLASYSQVDKTFGMIFTINMTKQKDELGQLSLTSKFTFIQKPGGHKELATAHRQLKRQLFEEILDKLDFDLTDTNDILFGTFDLKSKKFLDTTPEKFLQDFLVVSILKGHFMANKGYKIELLPSFRTINPEIKSFEVESISYKKTLPTIIKDQRAKRAIPASLRYKGLHRDKSICQKCGSTLSDGVKLHLDHIIPHSKGGLTVLTNLRTLCSDCNVGRSNRYVD